jgi:dienelactone hydrolase
MKTETLEYKDRDIRLLGYLAYDDKVSGKRPGVVVMPQVCGPGVHSRIKAERLAALGYVAFAADYYGNGRELDTLDEVVQLAHSLFNDTDAMRRRGLAASTSLPRSRRSIRRGSRRSDFAWAETFLSSSRARALHCAAL